MGDWGGVLVEKQVRMSGGGLWAFFLRLSTSVDIYVYVMRLFFSTGFGIRNADFLYTHSRRLAGDN